MNDPSKLEFLIFCIENAAEALGVSGAVAYRKLALRRFYESREYRLVSNGISDQHCMTPDYIVDDILAQSV